MESAGSGHSEGEITPGPFCKIVGITSNDLLQTNDIKSQDNAIDNLTNGLVLELWKFANKHRLPSRKVAIWLQQIFPTCLKASLKTLESRIARSVDTEKKFKKKKKNATFKSFNEFQSAKFLTNKKCTDSCETASENGEVINTKVVARPDVSKPDTYFQACTKSRESEREISTPCHDKTESDKDAPHKIANSSNTDTCNSEIQTDVNNSSVTTRRVTTANTICFKSVNEIKTEITKQQKKLNALKTLVQSEKDNLENLKKINGHFSVRNVNKRDENSRNTRKCLNKVRSAFAKQEKTLKTLENENSELRLKVNAYESDSDGLKSTVQRLKDCEHKKSKAQKLASHYRNTVKRFRENESSTKLKIELKKKQDEIDFLTNEQQTLKEKLDENTCCTKNSDGSFSNNVRLCVMELFALELGMEKIPSAIESIGRHMFNHTFEKTDLPTATTVRHIVDEGHYLTKSFIAYRIENSGNIGISRDGTMRKKEKILDTSVTLDSGEIFSLGFTKVSRETAENITNVTKSHMKELAETTVTSEFIANSLEKISFTMSDRASNEKLADKLLNDWRDQVIEQCGNENEKEAVFQFHCMAHVLLGFHRYVAEDLRKYEKDLVATEGPIGRDQLPAFKSWSFRQQTTAERIVYTASGTFGPVGDHLGVRDRWEAYCASNGVKSLIGNYKDNRFNSLFQTAAEVLLHREQFVEVIRTVNAPNKKVLSVEADLQSDTVCTILRALTIMYVKVTGPYWWLVTSGKVSYLHLYKHVQSLERFLVDCADNADLLSGDRVWINDNDLLVSHVDKFNEKIQETSHLGASDLSRNVLTGMCKSMLRTVRKQLSDFLDGGRYCQEPTEADMERTQFAQVNNLACEHHFGDLDSSQKRRPNASIHHHSSVQMMKRNGRNVTTWLSDMPEDEQRKIMKKARRGGVYLRKQHRDQEATVQREVLEIMEKGKKAKKRKIDNRACDSDDEFEIEIQNLRDMLPNMDSGFQENEYVAMAYQDAWYPGCVQQAINNDTAKVLFMIPCRKSGIFKWPAREDLQIVQKQFVIMRGIIPECLNSGRQWSFTEHSEITDIYRKYQQNYF